MESKSTLLSVEKLLHLVDSCWDKLYFHSHGLWVNKGWDSFPKHYEILYYIEGSNLLNMNDSVISAQKGDFVIIPDYLSKVSCEDSLFKLFYFTFYSPDPAVNQELSDNITSLCKELYNWHIPDLFDDFSFLLSELTESTVKPLFAKHHLMNILMKFYRSLYLTENSSDSQLRHGQITRQIINDLHENYGTKINLASIAGKYAMNERYLNHVFKQAVGETIGKYLMKIRIEKAKRLLETTGKTITHIAVETGFFDTAHFCRSFKKIEGVTPSEYTSLATLAVPPLS